MKFLALLTLVLVTPLLVFWDEPKLGAIVSAGVARGPDGFLYLCAMDIAWVRRVGPDGRIETYAGNGVRGRNGDGGPAGEASLNMPYELAWDWAGNLFIVALANNDVRRLDAKVRSSPPPRARANKLLAAMAEQRQRRSSINRTASPSFRRMIAKSATA